jgi:hypothetical protein
MCERHCHAASYHSTWGTGCEKSPGAIDLFIAPDVYRKESDR